MISPPCCISQVYHRTPYPPRRQNRHGYTVTNQSIDIITTTLQWSRNTSIFPPAPALQPHDGDSPVQSQTAFSNGKVLFTEKNLGTKSKRRWSDHGPVPATHSMGNKRRTRITRSTELIPPTTPPPNPLPRTTPRKTPGVRGTHSHLNIVLGPADRPID